MLILKWLKKSLQLMGIRLSCYLAASEASLSARLLPEIPIWLGIQQSATPFSTSFSQLLSWRELRAHSSNLKQNTNSRPVICFLMVTARETSYISAEKIDAIRGSEVILVEDYE